MALGVNTTSRSAWVTEILNKIDAGSGAGKVKFYDGTRPATNGAATNLLGTVTCSDPCGTVSNGVLTFSAFTDDSSADATGTATWARITDSADTFVCDASVGTSGADINLNSTSITVGGIIRITSGTLTAGNA
jgi:hypothetical protein